MYEIHEFTLFPDFKNCLTKMSRIPDVSVNAVIAYEETMKVYEEKMTDYEEKIKDLEA